MLTNRKVGSTIESNNSGNDSNHMKTQGGLYNEERC